MSLCLCDLWPFRLTPDFRLTVSSLVQNGVLSPEEDLLSHTERITKQVTHYYYDYYWWWWWWRWRRRCWCSGWCECVKHMLSVRCSLIGRFLCGSWKWTVWLRTWPWAEESSVSGSTDCCWHRFYCLSLYLSVFLNACLSTHLSIYPCLSVPPLVCLSTWRLCVSVPLYMSVAHTLSFYLSVFLSLFLSFSFYMVIFNSLSVCVCACAQKVLSELREDPQAFGVKSEILRTLPRGRTLVEYR